MHTKRENIKEDRYLEGIEFQDNDFILNDKAHRNSMLGTYKQKLLP
jgi:hypothetical protein